MNPIVEHPSIIVPLVSAIQSHSIRFRSPIVEICSMFSLSMGSEKKIDAAVAAKFTTFWPEAARACASVRITDDRFRPCCNKMFEILLDDCWPIPPRPVAAPKPPAASAEDRPVNKSSIARPKETGIFAASLIAVPDRVKPPAASSPSSSG